MKWTDGAKALVFLVLAGCASAPPPVKMVWLRTDGQTAHDHPALAAQFDIDRKICLGETQRAGISAAPVYTNNFIDAAIVANSRQRQMNDVAVGCMAGKGYVQVPEDQAEARAAEFRAATASGAIGTTPAGK